jgi:hypothetical protein
MCVEHGAGDIHGVDSKRAYLCWYASALNTQAEVIFV